MVKLADLMGTQLPRISLSNSGAQAMRVWAGLGTRSLGLLLDQPCLGGVARFLGGFADERGGLKGTYWAVEPPRAVEPFREVGIQTAEV